VLDFGGNKNLNQFPALDAMSAFVTWFAVHVSKCGNVTISVSNASGERSLSALKTVTSYLRNSVGQQVLGSLDVLT
jgi:hypothetical protein